MHLSLALLKTLLLDDVYFSWNKEHEAVFVQLKPTLKHFCELTKMHFLLWLKLLLSEYSQYLSKWMTKDKSKLNLYLSSIFTKKLTKTAVICRELTAIFYGLEKGEFLIFGSNHPITVFIDHKPILKLVAWKGNYIRDFSDIKLC